MKLIDLISEKINKDIHVQALIRIILVLLVVFLLKSTDTVWKGLFYKGWRIIRPFFLGFVIAYVLHPVIEKLEEKKIPRKVVVPVLYVLLLVLLGWLIFTLIPLLYSRLSSFINSMITGINSAYGTYIAISDSGAPVWVQRLVQEAVSLLQETRTVVPQLSSQLSNVLSDAMEVFTVTVLTLIISMYMCMSWEKIHDSILSLARRSGNRAVHTLRAVDAEIGSYLRSLLVLMVVKFIEYALMYYLVGHRDWMLVALLTAIGLIVPYIGPMIGNMVGILTALTLPTRNIIALIVCIVVLSQIDAYVIEPLIHSRNVKISPIWALFSIYAGGMIAGGFGVMAAIPVYLAGRTILRLNRQ